MDFKSHSTIHSFCRLKYFLVTSISIIEKYALSNIDIDVTKKYFNLQNECIVECDLKSTYGMIGYLLNIPFGDLYYLFSEKQTVTKEEILHRLIEEDVIKDIILNNLKELR